MCSTLAPTPAAQKEDASRTKGGRGEIRNVKAPRGSGVEKYGKKQTTKIPTLRLYLAGPSALLL